MSFKFGTEITASKHAANVKLNAELKKVLEKSGKNTGKTQA